MFGWVNFLLILGCLSSADNTAFKREMICDSDESNFINLLNDLYVLYFVSRCFTVLKVTNDLWLTQAHSLISLVAMQFYSPVTLQYNTILWYSWIGFIQAFPKDPKEHVISRYCLVTNLLPGLWRIFLAGLNCICRSSCLQSYCLNIKHAPFHRQLISIS